jgi:uncharacterized membrane protein
MSAQLFLDEEIRPHRSLSRQGFIVLLAVLTTFNVITAVLFTVIGAHIVPIFLGLDLVAVIAAFAASYRTAEHIERVQVSAAEVRVIHQFRQQVDTVWLSPTAQTQVAMRVRDEDDDELTLRLGQREFTFARALSPKRRADLARALDLAIWRARRSGWSTA